MTLYILVTVNNYYQIIDIINFHTQAAEETTTTNSKQFIWCSSNLKIFDEYHHSTEKKALVRMLPLLGTFLEIKIKTIQR